MKIEPAEAAEILRQNFIAEGGSDKEFVSLKYMEALRMGALALEKQIPKEPIRRERTLDGGGTTYWHICPSCKNRGLLDRWHRQLKHCPHCGQALEWPDESK